MKAVFKYTGGDVFSLYSLSDFYDAANRICEEMFGVTAPAGLAEIRTPDLGNSPTGSCFVIELTGASEDLLETVGRKWAEVGEGYNWECIGFIKKDIDIPKSIDSPLSGIYCV